MYISPGLVILIFRAIFGVPRGLYHLWNPAAYARWKVGRAVDAALQLHEGGCRSCREGSMLAHIDMVADGIHRDLVLTGVESDPSLILGLCRARVTARS